MRQLAAAAAPRPGRGRRAAATPPNTLTNPVSCPNNGVHLTYQQSHSHLFSPEDWRHIDAIYEEFQIPSDSFSLDPDLSKKLQDEFARPSGRIVPTMVISAAMVTRRKAGRLTTLKPKPSERDQGFEDIDTVVG